MRAVRSLPGTTSRLQVSCSAAVIAYSLWSHCQVRFASPRTTEGLFVTCPGQIHLQVYVVHVDLRAHTKALSMLLSPLSLHLSPGIPKTPHPNLLPLLLLLLLCAMLLFRIPFVLCLAPACSLPVAVGFVSNR